MVHRVVLILALLLVGASAACDKNCTGKGVCEGDACLCFDGYGGPACDVKTTGCPLGCSGHGKCMDGACDCDIGFQGAGCDQVRAHTTSSDVQLCTHRAPRTALDRPFFW